MSDEQLLTSAGHDSHLIDILAQRRTGFGSQNNVKMSLTLNEGASKFAQNLNDMNEKRDISIHNEATLGPKAGKNKIFSAKHQHKMSILSDSEKRSLIGSGHMGHMLRPPNFAVTLKEDAITASKALRPQTSHPVAGSHILKERMDKHKRSLIAHKFGLDA